MQGETNRTLSLHCERVFSLLTAKARPQPQEPLYPAAAGSTFSNPLPHIFSEPNPAHSLSYTTQRLPRANRINHFFDIFLPFYDKLLVSCKHKITTL
jgi:hypothetical protein